MKLTIALIAAAAVAALAASTPKAPQWEPIAPDALARFARDTTRAHQIDSVARIRVLVAQWNIADAASKHSILWNCFVDWKRMGCRIVIRDNSGQIPSFSRP